MFHNMTYDINKLYSLSEYKFGVTELYILKVLYYNKNTYYMASSASGEFCELIGYPSGQDGAILPARDCPFRSRK